MDRKKTKPEVQELDLEDSIDALLEEVDATCASVENPKAGKPGHKQSDQPEAVAAAEPNESASPKEAETAPAEIDSVHDEALEALDRVEEKTQELLENTIDQLLNDAPEPGAETAAFSDAPVDGAGDAGDASDVHEPKPGPAGGVETVDPVDDARAVAGTSIDEAAIDAQLDALENSDTAAPASEPPTTTPAAEASETLETPEELLDQIADDLTAGAGQASQDQAAEPEPVQSSPESETATPGTEAPAPVEASALDPISDAVDSMLSGDLNPPADASGVEPGSSSEEDILTTLADLDASLAGASMELMGDFETPEGELISSDSLNDVNDASTLLEQLGLDELSYESPKHEDRVEKSTPDPSVAMAEHPQASPVEQAKPSPSPRGHEAQPAPSAKTTTQSVRAGVLEPLPTLTEPEGEVESIWQSARRLLVTHGRHAMVLARTHAGPIGARVVFAINKPVRERPAQLRDSIGYLALWTLLLAMILWVYLAFIRVTPTPKPTQAPSRMLQPGEIVDSLRTNEATP